MSMVTSNVDTDESTALLAQQMVNVAAGQTLNISAAAAALALVLFSEQVKCPDFDKLLAAKLRQVANMLNPIETAL